MKPKHVFLAIGAVLVLGMSIAFLGFVTLLLTKNIEVSGPLLGAGAIVGIGGMVMGAVFVLLTEIFGWDLE